MPARPPEAPAFVMGLGLGGFIDGIVLHQVIQWHHLLTGENGGEPATTVAGLEANTLADGFFHLATWALVVAGMVLTVRAWQRWDLGFLGLGVLLILGGLALARAQRSSAGGAARSR